MDHKYSTPKARAMDWRHDGLEAANPLEGLAAPEACTQH
jgi:hypothetical protein